jgi:hypothetical protein
MTICPNASVLIPACVAIAISRIAFIPPDYAAFLSPLSAKANGSFAFFDAVSFHDGNGSDCAKVSGFASSKAAANAGIIRQKPAT